MIPKPLSTAEFQQFAALLERFQWLGTELNPVAEEHQGMVCVSYRDPNSQELLTVTCIGDADYTLLDLFDGIKFAPSAEAKAAAFDELVSWVDSYVRGTHHVINIPKEFLQELPSSGTTH